MEILLWLLPAALATCAAMAWVSWIGRQRPERKPTTADEERFARAIMRPIPEEHRRPRQRERSTGVARRREHQQPDQRPDQQPGQGGATRRSA